MGDLPVDKKSFFSHIEALVPGIATLFLGATLVPESVANSIENSVMIKLFLKQSFIAGSVFIALSYLTGVLIFAVSRAVVDTLSELLPRWILLLVFEWKEFKDGRKPWQVNDTYRKKLYKARGRKEWQPEIDKRRERGRLIRTTVVPVALILSNLIPWAWACIVSVATVTIVYSYIELSIFKEVKLALTPLKESQGELP